MAKQADDMQTLAMSRLEYLWESGHVYCEIDPVLSRSLLYVEDPFKVLECCARRAKRSSRGSILNCSPYSLDMVKTAAQYNINLAAKIQQRLCTFCGTLYIPGANCSVRIQRANHAQRNRKEVPAASSKDHCDMETDIDGQHAKRNQPTVRNPNGSTRLPETEKMSTVVRGQNAGTPLASLQAIHTFPVLNRCIFILKGASWERTNQLCSLGPCLG
jgi:hypothetical protein